MAICLGKAMIKNMVFREYLMFGQTEIGTFSPTNSGNKNAMARKPAGGERSRYRYAICIHLYNPFVMAYYGQYHRHIPLTRAHRHSGIPKHI